MRSGCGRPAVHMALLAAAGAGLVALRVLNDKRHVLTRDCEGQVQLWDVLAGRPIQELGKVMVATIGPGSRGAACCIDGSHAADSWSASHAAAPLLSAAVVLGMWLWTLSCTRCPVEPAVAAGHCCRQAVRDVYAVCKDTVHQLDSTYTAAVLFPMGWPVLLMVCSGGHQ